MWVSLAVEQRQQRGISKDAERLEDSSQESRGDGEVCNQAALGLGPGAAFQEICATRSGSQLPELPSLRLHSGVIACLAELLQQYIRRRGNVSRRMLGTRC